MRGVLSQNQKLSQYTLHYYWLKSMWKLAIVITKYLCEGVYKDLLERKEPLLKERVESKMIDVHYVCVGVK